MVTRFRAPRPSCATPRPPAAGFTCGYRRREASFGIRQTHHVIARSEATKQSILPRRGAMDCFASLAMTVSPQPYRLHRQYCPSDGLRQRNRTEEGFRIEVILAGFIDNPQHVVLLGCC